MRRLSTSLWNAKLSPHLASIGALAGVAIACVVSRIFYGRNQGPDGTLHQILGSFFALIGFSLAAGLVRHLLAAGKTLRVLGRPLDPNAAVSRGAPLALVLVGSAWTAWPCLSRTPLSHDHPTHIFQAWHFWSEMLARGRLRGWSDYWGFGFPSGELTPFGPDLWVAFFRMLTCGSLSWTRTYSIAFGGMLVFATVAMYRFTERFFGAAAGVIAAMLWLLDPGGWCEGGWNWQTTYGVWPVSLGLAFTLLALVRLDRVASAPPRRRDALMGALWMAASLVTHQLPFIVYPLAVPLLVLAHRLQGPLPRGALLRVVGTLAIGFGLAAFYVVPMMARSGLTLDLGVQGISLEELGHRWVEIRLFESEWQLLTVLGMVGAVLAVRGGHRASAFFVGCAVLFVLLCSDILVSVLHIERIFPGILKLEAQRTLLVAKLFWFPLTAYAAVTVSRQVRNIGNALPRSFGQRAMAVLVFAVLAAPLAKPVALHIYGTQVKKELEPEASNAYWTDLQPFFAWSLAARQATQEFYRIAYALPMHDHMSTIAPVFNHTLAYKVGYTPAQQFSSFPMTGEPEVLEALSVKYLVTDHPVTDPDFTLEQTFGLIQVYRFRRYDPSPFTVIGSGRVERIGFEPEYVHLRLRDVRPGSRLRLHVANYPRWEATLNGAHLPITSAPVYGAEYPILMEVPAADGDLVFRYVSRAADRVGLTVSLLALVACAVVALGRGPSLGEPWGWARALRLSKGNAWVSYGLAVGFAVLLMGGVAWNLATPERLPGDSAFRLESPRDGVLSLAGVPCVAQSTASWQCGSNEVRYDVVSGIYGSHLCMTAPAIGPLRLESTARLGPFVEGRYDPGGGNGQILARVDGQTVGDMPTRGVEQGLQFVQFDTRAYAAKTARLEIELSGAALHCFDFRIPRVRVDGE